MAPETIVPFVRVGVIGLGRVGSAIARAVAGLPRGAEFRLVGVSPHRLHEPCPLADEVDVPMLGPIDLLCFADLTVLAAPDDALAQAAGDLGAAFEGEVRQGAGALVHCSGALDASVLDPLAAAGWTLGAWHPLQAFPTTSSPVRPGITWAVTAPEPLASRLRTLSAALGGRAFELPAQAKPRYHAAASMAANYLVTQVWHATRLLEDCGLHGPDALAALIPLLESTVAGLATAGLPGGLTGPLARGDAMTVARHLEALESATPRGTDALYRAVGTATLPLLQARGLDPDLVGRLADLLAEPAPTAEGDGGRPGPTAEGRAR